MAQWNRGVRRQRRGRVPREPRVPAVDDRGRRRQRDPDCLAAWQRRCAGTRGLLRVEGRAHSIGEDDGGGSCGAERAGQYALARRGRDDPHGAPLRRHGNRAAHLRAETSARAARPARRDRHRGGVSGERRLALHDRRGFADRRRLQRDVSVD